MLGMWTDVISALAIMGVVIALASALRRPHPIDLVDSRSPPTLAPRPAESGHDDVEPDGADSRVSGGPVAEIRPSQMPGGKSFFAGPQDYHELLQPQGFSHGTPLVLALATATNG